MTTKPSPMSVSEVTVLSLDTEQQPSSDQKVQSSQIILKATSADKFNWWKYGQKQVKSSESSRSYYRCTQANCSAKKKVEHCLHGRVLEVVYKGGHNHDPPGNLKSPKERNRQSIVPSGDNGTFTHESGETNENVPSQFKVGQDPSIDTPEQESHCSSDCEVDAGNKTEENPNEARGLKRRFTERLLASPSSRFKAGKEARIVVQTASDAGPSSDSYRCQKYGQKLVKGNPNPRSYYKCTQIGCPARKHIERHSADAKALIIQYESEHNHDLPASKDGNAPATALLIAAAAAAMDADVCTPSPSEKASELGGDGVLESAQALLSISLKSTSEEGRREMSEVNTWPIFDKNLAVSVENF